MWPSSGLLVLSCGYVCIFQVMYFLKEGIFHSPPFPSFSDVWNANVDYADVYNKPAL